MNFSELSPSKQWAALRFRGEKFAEVWIKPDGDPRALTFRISQASFQLPGLAPHLTAENLLKAVAVAPGEVESWRHGAVSHDGPDPSSPELKKRLPAPPPAVAHLEISVRLKPPAPAADGAESDQATTAALRWQEIEMRWKNLLGLEASLDILRKNVATARAEMEASSRRGLTTEEKLNALQADIVQWNRAKTRVHYALPKANEFIHRAVWAQGTPERKRMDEFFKNSAGSSVPLPELDKVLEELEVLRKDCQILTGQGTTVYQECKNISAEMQGTLRTLLANSASRALKKRGATGPKGRSF